MFCIKIADMCIGIDNKYNGVFRLCRDYICEGEPEFSVCVGEEEIVEELKNYGGQATPDYAESVCIYRSICQKLPDFGAFLLHAAIVECDGVSYAFSAPSGTGKSTHAALWLSHFGSKARIINGDKPIICIKDDKIIACGTPWCGKEGKNENTSSELASLCFIERGEKNEIRRIDAAEAVTRVFSQILMPKTEGKIDKLFSLLDRMLCRLPCYVLRCTVSDEAVSVAYNGMKGE